MFLTWASTRRLASIGSGATRQADRQAPIRPIDPVPAVSSIVPPPPLTLPLNTAPGSTISLLALLLAVKSTAKLVPEIVPALLICHAVPEGALMASPLAVVVTLPVLVMVRGLLVEVK